MKLSIQMQDALVEDVVEKELCLEEDTDDLKKKEERDALKTKNNEIFGEIQMREAWDLPDQSTWPHGPVMICNNTAACPSVQVPKYGNGPCPLGVPFDFESDLFVGKCLVRLRDIPGDADPDENDRYFKGRRRVFQSIIQGRFKEELNVSKVLTGHEFVRRPQPMPPSWMVKFASATMKRLVPGAQIEVHTRQPHMLSISAGTYQAVRADTTPGTEPDICNINITEDVSQFGGYFETTRSRSQRKRHFSNPKRASEYTYDTSTTYTFDFYQHLLDVGTYTVDLGYTKFGVASGFDGQPIQVMSKTDDGRYLWSFQLWHKDLLGDGAKEQSE